MSKPTVIDAETGEILEQEPQTQAVVATPITDTRLATPEMSLEAHGKIHDALDSFVHARMKPATHFTQIPGVEKPSLSKVGAEDLNTFFGFKHRFVDEKTTVDFERGYIDCTVKCQIGKYADDGAFYVFAECLGSCNSYETKYRYRSKPKKKASPDEIATALRVETRTGKYGPYEVVVIENNAFDVKNTIQKMAQKRAYVGATLFATGADKHFTQDVEDMEQFRHDAQPEAADAQPQDAPRQERKAAPKTTGFPVNGSAWLDEPLNFGKQHAAKTWRQMVTDKTPNSKGEIEFAGPSYLKWMSEKVNDPTIKAKAQAAFEMYLNMDLEKPAEPAAAPEPAQPEAQIDKAADKAKLKKRAENRVLYMEQELARRGIKKFSDLSKEDQDSLNAEIESWLDADQDDIPF